jgi:hypothetical protein
MTDTLQRHHQAYADRLALLAWADKQLVTATPRVQRFVSAVADMTDAERVRFLSIAFLFTGDLAQILRDATND